VTTAVLSRDEESDDDDDDDDDDDEACMMGCGTSKTSVSAARVHINGQYILESPHVEDAIAILIFYCCRLWTLL